MMDAAGAWVRHYTGARRREDVGRVLGVFWTPGDVRDLKARISPVFESVNTDVEHCAALPADMRAAWQLDYKAWSVFRDTELSIWNVGGQADQAEAWERRIADWQPRIAAAKCSVSAPQVVPSGDRPSETQQTIRMATVAASVIAGAVVLVLVLSRLPGGR